MSRLGWLSALILVACASGPKPVPAPPPQASVAPPVASAEPSAEKPAAPRSEPGTREKVEELRSADRISDPIERFSKKAGLLRDIRELADPRGADALHAYASAEPEAQASPGERFHFRNEIGFALAELGDVRAVPLLAECLERDPLEAYDESDQQTAFRRSDQERVMAARLIADLAMLHPDRVGELSPRAAPALAAWLSTSPAPHANALRARARLGITDDETRRTLRAWADPRTPLPKPGAQPPFPEEFAVAQSALRWLGASKDPQAAAILKKQLGRRPKAFDATMNALISGGSALLGMTLRALGSGASEGLSELGDSKAVPWLLAYIDDDKEHEQSRLEACEALAWLATPAHAPEIEKRVKAWSLQKTDADRFRLGCLLDGMAKRRLDALVPAVTTLLRKDMNDALRLNAAIVLGRGGLDSPTEDALVGKLDEPDERLEAAVALLLGGSQAAVDRVAALAVSQEDAELSQLRASYSLGLSGVFDADLDQGHLFRWVENAQRLSGVSRRGKPLGFALDALRGSLDSYRLDIGPHSLTRVVLRGRLFALARAGGPDAKRASAVLELLHERGVLLALAEPAPK